MKMHLTSTTCLIALAFTATLKANTYFVDNSLPAACDSYNVSTRSCNGADAPAFATIDQALAQMSPGDRLLIRGGTYKEPLAITKSGTPGAPIEISGYGAEPTVIDLANASGSSSGVVISGRNNVVLSSLTITNSNNYGIEVYNSSNVQIINCQVSYSANGGIVVFGGSNVSVSGSQIHHNNASGGGSAMEAVSFQDVNTFSITTSQVYSNNKEGIDSKYGSTNGTISHNLSYSNNGPNIYLDGTNNISVFDNICSNTVSVDKAGIGIAVETSYNPGAYTTHDLKVYNNVVYGNGAGISIWLENPSLSWVKLTNITIAYNTLSDNNRNNWGGIYVMNGSTNNFGSGNTIENNVLWNNGGRGIRDDANVVRTFSVSNNSFKSGESSTTLGTAYTMLSADPFQNDGSGNFQLTASPEIPGGSILSSITTQDMNGKTRASNEPNAGAYM
jgi:hypothetical protein